MSSTALAMSEEVKRSKSHRIYHVENPDLDGKAERFLKAFAAILQYGDYKPLLDSYSASSAKCSRCVVTCPIYQVTQAPRDIPCYRAGLLLDIYKRHFTVGGWLALPDRQRPRADRR